ncbi:MAG: hypothetical protein LBH72_07770 [Proteiniphilum sp.]|nr:hypothetical protein [Proteiniphilum sp.]
MKTLALVLLALAAHVSVSAQLNPIIGSKNLIPIKGGSEGKSYAVIIRTDLSKQALVDSTTLFLARYNLVDIDDVRLDEIDEATSEYIIPFEIRQTISVVNMALGISILTNPVRILGDLRFEFHDNGGVMIVVQNLENRIFQFVEKDGNRLMTKFDQLEKDEAYQEYGGEGSAVLMTKTSIGKALIAMNTGLDGYDAFMARADDYFADIDSKYKVYDKLVEQGVAAWLTDEELIQYVDSTKSITINREMKNSYRKAYDEGRMLGVGQQRWENQIRDCFDVLFKSINVSLAGNIEGVAEDGEQTWINIDGTVVPVDPKWKDGTPPDNPKDREKYLKKHKKNQY